MLRVMLWTYRCIIRYTKVCMRSQSKSFHLLRQTLANATDAKWWQQVTNYCSINMLGWYGDEWSPLCFTRSPQLWIHQGLTLVLKIRAAENVFKTLSMSCPTANSSPSNIFVHVQHTALQAERHLLLWTGDAASAAIQSTRNSPLWILPQRAERPLLSTQTDFQSYRNWRVLWSSSYVSVLCFYFLI